MKRLLIMNCECNSANAPVCPRCGVHSEFEERDVQYLGIGTGSSSKEITILPELSEFKFTDEMKLKISQLYNHATDGKTKRNAPRRATIYLCIVSVCKDIGLAFNAAELQQKLDIKEKNINKASKELVVVLGHKKVEVTIENEIASLMRDFDIVPDRHSDILKIHSHCKRTSKLFNSSKVDTLAAGVVYYYLITQLPDYPVDIYFEKSKVSKDTVLTVYEEIQKCIGANQ